MIGYRPPRPMGSSPEALFMQAVWDKLWGSETRLNDVSGQRVSRTLNDVSGQRVSRTTRGVFMVDQPGGAAPAAGNQCPYG